MKVLDDGEAVEDFGAVEAQEAVGLVAVRRGEGGRAGVDVEKGREEEVGNMLRAERGSREERDGALRGVDCVQDGSVSANSRQD